ncbi:hypothetical protein ACFLRN_07075 [Thermoproteota archaeon]
MNKILVYSVLAILLGTVTMFVPLYVLEQRGTIPEGTYILDVPDSEPSQEDRGIETGGSFEANDMLHGPETPAPEPTPEPEPAPVESSNPDSEELEVWSTIFSSDSSSSIGLMIVPSFLIALGAFVYLKKRMA